MSTAPSKPPPFAPEWYVVCLGTGGGYSNLKRSAQATAVRIGESLYLIDCGEGTVRQLAEFGVLRRRIEAILLTAATSDQMAGLLSLADYLRRPPRLDVVRIAGPPGTAAKFEALQAFEPSLDGLFTITELDEGTPAEPGPGLYIDHVELDRPSGEVAYAYAFYEDPLPGRIDPQRAEQRGISGPDLARIQRGETVRGVRPREIQGPPRPGRRMVISGIGRPTDELADAMTGAELAILPAPYLDERLELAQATGTMTGWEAGELARRARTRMLLLLGMAGNCHPGDYRAEVRQFYRHVITPNDGDRVTIPTPGNGPPRFESRQKDAQRQGRVARARSG